MPTNPCHTGLIDCTSGSPVCNDTGNPVNDGTACGTGGTCCTGACVDEQTDNANCGTCAHACTSPTTCQGAICTPPNIVFVTSAQFTGGNLGGLAGMDADCQAAAQAASLSGTFIAYASTSATNASSRVAGARGWIRTDGMPVADQPSQLTSGSLWYPIDHDENGHYVGNPTAFVFSGSNAGGAYYTNYSCLDWTTSASTSSFTSGVPQGEGSVFESYYFPTCDKPGHRYCMQVTQKVPVTVTKVSGRYAFLSSAGFTTGGLAAADAKCQSDAQAASLPGTYAALLATSTATAASRFSTSGPTWVRPDGVPVFAQASDLTSFALIAPIMLGADGSWHQANYTVSAGANSVTVAGTLATTCQDWTSNASTDSYTIGLTGFDVYNGNQPFGASPQNPWPCTGPSQFICLQQ